MGFNVPVLLKYVRGKFCLFSLLYSNKACPIWRRFDPHFTRLAVSRARLSDGRRIEISSAMIPITTSSSTRVKPRRAGRLETGIFFPLNDTGGGIAPRAVEPRDVGV